MFYGWHLWAPFLADGAGVWRLGLDVLWPRAMSEDTPKPYDVTVMTMFPEAFPGPLGVSLIGTSWKESNRWALETLDIRNF